MHWLPLWTFRAQNGTVRSKPMKILRRVAKNITDSILRKLFVCEKIMIGGRKIWQ